MSTKSKTSPHEKHAEETRCAKCKSTGVIVTWDGYRATAVCCDGCETGRLTWSRTSELLADMDVPSPVPVQPERIDSIVRDVVPRRHQTH